MASSKKKVITFEDQIKRLNDNFGISESESANVFSSHKKVMEEIIAEQRDAEVKEFEMITYAGNYNFSWDEEATKVDSSGNKFTSPAHYNMNFAAPRFMIDLANEKVDFSGVPSMNDIKSAVA